MTWIDKTNFSRVGRNNQFEIIYLRQKITSCGWAGPSSAKLGLRWAKLVGCRMRANISHDTVKNQPHFMLRWVQLLLVLPKYTITGVWVGERLAGKGKNFIFHLECF